MEGRILHALNMERRRVFLSCYCQLLLMETTTEMRKRVSPAKRKMADAYNAIMTTVCVGRIRIITAKILCVILEKEATDVAAMGIAGTFRMLTRIGVEGTLVSASTGALEIRAVMTNIAKGTARKVFAILGIRETNVVSRGIAFLISACLTLSVKTEA